MFIQVTQFGGENNRNKDNLVAAVAKVGQRLDRCTESQMDNDHVREDTSVPVSLSSMASNVKDSQPGRPDEKGNLSLCNPANGTSCSS